jgi:hypothetical protein
MRREPVKKRRHLANEEFSRKIAHALSVRYAVSQALEKQSRRKRGDGAFYVPPGVLQCQLNDIAELLPVLYLRRHDTLHIPLKNITAPCQSRSETGKQDLIPFFQSALSV